MVTIRNVLGAVAGLTAMLWGSLHVTVQVLLLLMAVDIVFGVAAAYSNRTLSSRVGWKGVTRKVGTLGVVAATTIVQPLLGFEISVMVTGFYSAVEALSIIEGAATLGVPIPGVLTRALIQLRAETVQESPSLPGSHEPM